MATTISPSELYIRFYHPTIENLSDRTLRTLIKELSKVCKNIVVDEIDDLLDEIDLEYRIKQSVRDKVKKEVPSVSIYYVEKIEKGSFEILVAIGAGVIWLLKSTIGKSITDGYRKAKISKDIEDATTKSLDTIRDYVATRPATLIEKIPEQISGLKLGNVFGIKDVSIEQAKAENIILVLIETRVDPDKESYRITMDNRGLLKELDSDLSKSKKNRITKTVKGKTKKRRR